MTGYTGFSGESSEQSGNYLALYVGVPDVTGVTYTAELVNGILGHPVTLDSDQTIIFRITNKATQKIRVTAVKDGYTATKEYSLSGLTLNAS